MTVLQFVLPSNDELLGSDTKKFNTRVVIFLEVHTGF